MTYRNINPSLIAPSTFSPTGQVWGSVLNADWHQRTRLKGVSSAWTLGPPVLDGDVLDDDGSEVEREGAHSNPGSEEGEIANGPGWMFPATGLNTADITYYAKDERTTALQFTNRVYDWTVIPVQFPVSAFATHIEVGLWLKTEVGGPGFEGFNFDSNELAQLQAPVDFYLYCPNLNVEQPPPWIPFVNPLTDTGTPPDEITGFNVPEWEQTPYGVISNYSGSYRFFRFRLPISAALAQLRNAGLSSGRGFEQDPADSLPTVYLCFHSRLGRFFKLSEETASLVYPVLRPLTYFDATNPFLLHTFSNVASFQNSEEGSDILNIHYDEDIDDEWWVRNQGWRWSGKTWKQLFVTSRVGPLVDPRLGANGCNFLVLKETPSTLLHEREVVPPGPPADLPPVIASAYHIYPAIGAEQARAYSQGITPFLYDGQPTEHTQAVAEALWESTDPFEWFQANVQFLEYYTPHIELASFYVREVHLDNITEPYA